MCRHGSHTSYNIKYYESYNIITERNIMNVNFFLKIIKIGDI